jgi:hypothetical protein
MIVTRGSQFVSKNLANEPHFDNSWDNVSGPLIKKLRAWETRNYFLKYTLIST